MTARDHAQRPKAAPDAHKAKTAPKKLPVKSVTKELDALRLELQKARGGYHQEVYRVMAGSLVVALVLRENKTLARNFVRRVRPRAGNRKDGAAINLFTEVMVYVMGAATDSGRKLAWKRGRVIEYLHEEGVKIENIPSQIKARGGIEAVFKQAVKQQPRREKGSVGTKTGAKKSKPPVVKPGDKQDRDPPDSNESAVIPAKSAGGSRRNDRKVIMPVLVTLSARDMLDESPIGTRVQIVATRTNEMGTRIEANRVTKLKSVVRKEDDDDWK
jgi:hypothetical protein